MRATSDVGVCSYCVTVVAFSCFIRLLFVDLLLCADTVQGNYNVPRNGTGYFSPSVHSLPAWVTLTATPERDMAAGHVPAVQAQRGQQPALGQGHHESSQR